MTDIEAGVTDPAALIAGCRNPGGRGSVEPSLLAAQLAVTLARTLPRGKGAVPRWIGANVVGERLFALSAHEGFDYVGDGQGLEALAYYASGKAHGADVVNLCRALTRPDDVFYDIGANVGHVALSMAHSHKGARIVAFEPIPRLARAITCAATRNGFDHLEIYAAALDRELGHTSFFVTPLSTQASLVGRKVAGVEELRIPTLTLDSMIQSGAIPPPAVVKLDVEGAEMRLMDGAEQTFRTHLPVLFYECDQNAERFGHTPAEFMERLRGMGYVRFFRIEGSQRTEIDVGDPVPFGDILAVDKGKADRLAKLYG